MSKRLWVTLALVVGCEGSNPTGSGGQGGQPGGCGVAELWDGSACVAVGVKGCAESFLVDGVCAPTADACPAGTMPKLDEGCVAVGPQGCAPEFIGADGLCWPDPDACPPGTIVDLDVGCVPVGISNCADEFVDPVNGLCKPRASACAPGTFPVPSLGCVSVDGAGCGTGTWGNIADLPGTVYVDPSYLAGDGDGSKAKPFATIAQGIALAGPGDRVALAAGTYDEGVDLLQGEELVGRCPSLVRIQGSILAFGGFSAINVHGADGGAVRGVSTSGQGFGITLNGVSGVEITDVWVDGNVGFGILLTHADALMDRVYVSDTAVGSQQVCGAQSCQEGRGLNLVSTSTVEVHRSAFVGNHLAGIAATAPSEIHVFDSVVDGTLPFEAGSPGYGIMAAAGPSTVTDTAVIGSHAVGVLVDDADVEITSSLVLETTGEPGLGDAVLVRDGGNLHLVSSAVVASETYGVFVMLGSFLEMEGCLVTGTVETGDISAGVAFMSHATGLIHKCQIDDNDGRGINVQEVDGVTVERSVVRRTHRAADGFARGVQLTSGAQAIVKDNVIVENGEIGLTVQDAFSIGTLEHNLIAENGIEVDEAVYSAGVLILDAEATLLGDALIGNQYVGLASDASVVTADAVLARGTAPNPALTDLLAGGTGFVSSYGGQLTLRGSVGHGNAAAGFMAVSGGATAEVRACAFFENGFGGVIVGGEAAGSIFDTVASHNLPGPLEGEFQFGAGVQVQAGGSLTLTDCTLLENPLANLMVLEGNAVVQGLLALSAQPGIFKYAAQTGEGADGVACSNGSIDLQRSVVAQSNRAGLLFSECSGAVGFSAASGGAFGLVLQGQLRPTVNEDLLLFDNATNAVENGELSVPAQAAPLPSIGG